MCIIENFIQQEGLFYRDPVSAEFSKRITKEQRKRFRGKKGIIPRPFWDYSVHVGLLESRDVPLREDRSLTTLAGIVSQKDTSANTAQDAVRKEIGQAHHDKAKQAVREQIRKACQEVYRKPGHPWPDLFETRKNRPLKTALFLGH